MIEQKGMDQMGNLVRPRIALLGRFAEHTSATRYSAIVTSEKLAQMIWDLGGEPLTLLPAIESDWKSRLAGYSGVLMPGGGDVNPAAYGEMPSSEHLYGVNDLQDATDVELFNFALRQAIPVLTICRGTQIANVALGGSLTQHMNSPHIDHVSVIEFDTTDSEIKLSHSKVQALCYHHQAINTLGKGIEVLARGAEGHVEAVKYPVKHWAYGVQWHPEFNYQEEPLQSEFVAAFIDAAREFGNF